MRDVARELDVNHETLRNWVGALKRERATPGGPVSGDEPDNDNGNPRDNGNETEDRDPDGIN